MATEIARFVVGCIGDEANEFHTTAEQWEAEGRLLLTLAQTDPYTQKVDMILLDKADVLLLADQLRGH